MKSLETQIVIAASPSEVWAVLLDFAAYPQWNPFLVSVKGEAKTGAYLDNTIKNGKGKDMRFQPEVLVVDTEREFRWKGKLWVKGLFDGEHYFKLEATEAGHTLLTHGEHFSGLLSGVLMKMIGEDTRMGFEAMNQALKARVEQVKEVGHVA